MDKKFVFINSITSIGSRLTRMLVGVFLTPYLLLHLSRESVGLQIIGYQLMQYCFLLSNAANRGYLRVSSTHYATNDLKGLNRTLGQGLTLILIVSLPICLLIGIFVLFPTVFLGVSPELADEASFVIAAIGISYFWVMITDLWASSLFIKERLYINDINDLLIRTGSFAVLVIAFSYTSPSIEKWISINLIVTILIILFYKLPRSRKLIPEIRIRPVWKNLREATQLFSTSFYTFFGTVGFLLYFATDSLIISNLDSLGPDKVIVYNIGQRWDPIIRSFLMAFTFALSPGLIKIFATQGTARIKHHFHRSNRISYLMAILPSVWLLANAYPFISVWIDEQMAIDASLITQLMMVNLLLSVTSATSHAALEATGNLRWPTITTLIGGVINIIGSILLVLYTELGLFGVAIATLVTLGIRTTITTPLFMKIYLDIELKDYLIHSLVRPIILFLVTLLMSYLILSIREPSNWFEILLHASTLSILYCPCAFFIGLTKNDRVHLLDTLREFSFIKYFINKFKNQSSGNPK